MQKATMQLERRVRMCTWNRLEEVMELARTKWRDGDGRYRKAYFRLFHIKWNPDVKKVA